MNTITAQDLKDRIDNDSDTLVIDVLPTDHFESEHIPGATNVPLGAERFADAVEGIAESKKQPVVVYCASTDCDLSPKAAEQLEQAGFRNVADFEGGIEEWKASGFDVTQG
jgi:rhodanese-related sulfurtransferase